MIESYYDLLGIPPDATLAEINAAYSKLRKQYKQDQEYLRKIEQAWRTLANPFDRGRYDHRLANDQADSQVNGDPQETHFSATPTSNSKRRSTEVIEISKQKHVPSSSKSSKRKGTEVIEVSFEPQDSTIGQPQERTAQEPRPKSTAGRRRRDPTELISAQQRAKRKQRPLTEEMAGIDSTEQESVAGARVVEEEFDEGRSTGEDEIEDGDSAGPPDRAQIELLVTVTFEGQTHSFHLLGGKQLIGRPSKKSNPDIPIGRTNTISRNHAFLSFRDGRCKVIDNGSLNGTSLNGQKLNPGQEYEFEPGDVVTIEGREIRVQLPFN